MSAAPTRVSGVIVLPLASGNQTANRPNSAFVVVVVVVDRAMVGVVEPEGRAVVGVEDLLAGVGLPPQAAKSRSTIQPPRRTRITMTYSAV